MGISNISNVVGYLEGDNRRIFEDKFRNKEGMWDSVDSLASSWASVPKEFKDVSYFFIRNYWGAIIV